MNDGVIGQSQPGGNASIVHVLIWFIKAIDRLHMFYLHAWKTSTPIMKRSAQFYTLRTYRNAIVLKLKRFSVRDELKSFSMAANQIDALRKASLVRIHSYEFQFKFKVNDNASANNTEHRIAIWTMFSVIGCR